MRNLSLLLILMGVILSRCQAGYDTLTTVVTPEASAETQFTPRPLATYPSLTATPSSAPTAKSTQVFQKWRVKQVLDAFEAAGLEIGDVKFNDPFYLFGAPKVAAEYALFHVTSWGKDAGGLIFAFTTQPDMEAVYKYYKDSGMYDNGLYYPWVATKDNILLQINGILSKPEAEKYLFALSNLK